MAWVRYGLANCSPDASIPLNCDGSSRTGKWISVVPLCSLFHFSISVNADCSKGLRTSQCKSICLTTRMVWESSMLCVSDVDWTFAFNNIMNNLLLVNAWSRIHSSVSSSVHRLLIQWVWPLNRASISVTRRDILWRVSCPRNAVSAIPIISYNLF